MFSRLTQKLYLRIWFAVVLILLVLSVLTALAWRLHFEDEQRLRMEGQAQGPGARVLIVRNEFGDELARSTPRLPRRPGEGVEFDVTMPDGKHLRIQLPPRPRPPEMSNVAPPLGFGRQEIGGGERLGPRPRLSGGEFGWLPVWARPPYGFLWLFGVVSLAIAMGAYPVARRLTTRIEALQKGVRQFGEGDLSTRVDIKGNDEIAYLAEQFNSSAQRIQGLVQAQRSLLANASHELRSPLTRIRMGLEILAQGHGAQGGHQSLLKEIRRSIAELDELIEEILLASRLDAPAPPGQESNNREDIDLLGLVVEEAARVEAKVDFDSSNGLGAESYQLKGSGKLLVRLVRNLLENARRYSQGEIEIELGRSRRAMLVATGRQEQMDVIEIRVSDHGPGVPASQRERIFEPFYRLPGASEREGGVGLGLALVKSIASNHRGHVFCTDRPDAQPGASFVVYLPCASKVTT